MRLINECLDFSKNGLFLAGLTVCIAAPFSAMAQKSEKTAKVGGAGVYELAVSESTGAVYVAAAPVDAEDGGIDLVHGDLGRRVAPLRAELLR